MKQMSLFSIFLESPRNSTNPQDMVIDPVVQEEDNCFTSTKLDVPDWRSDCKRR